MDSHLNKKKKFVQTNHIIPEHNTISYGISQGSTFGPKLIDMYIYVNDLCNMSTILT